MTTFTVKTTCGTEKSFDSLRRAKEGKETHATLCEECEADDISIEQSTRTETAKSRSKPDAAPLVTDGSSDLEPRPLPNEMPDTVQMDPLDIVPDYMIDEVDGQPTINKRGYAVIARQFDIIVSSEAITTAGETDHQFAEFKASAWKKEDGPEHAYTGHGTALASENRTGIENNLNEMAETRAMKRAVAWASGIGILAWEEMRNHLDE
ncbi:hypothetical protein [Haladaptatus salinisoli]|uniref:hypothetical protein n=1 Tax=Haladaptatus salinisoli TaxID=2884876 RepID=UPI001D0A25A7|nr:hypothetical protein [Haladaptatus salinisoli]